MKKIVFQSDFDGTITWKDVSFLFLDAFVGPRWREELKEYTARKISVGAFNTKVFSMIKAGKQELLDYMFRSGKVEIRPGFRELLDYCSGRGFRFIIVSNGIDFYIEALLKDMGIENVEFHAASSRFVPGQGMDVRYIGPDGKQMETGLKEAYTELMQGDGCDVIYAGNGVSDIYPARRARHVFATGDLLERCRQEGLACIPFNDLHDIVREMESLELG
jgi:2-hydroxy-3-keto-5-methylthiopentenyl-1-phosphate phosphatase